MRRLQDKVCLITGGAGSVGLATARLFLDEGAKVALIDMKAADLARAMEGLDPARVIALTADVSNSAEVAAAVAATVARLGTIDVLFSNAGNFGTVAPIESYPEEVFEAVIAVHVKGAFLMAKHVSPHLRDGGSIIITSSVAGVRGDAGVYGYIVAKHAQVGLMRVLAKELAPRRIRVNTIHPGPIDNGFQHAVEAGLSVAIQRDGAEFFNQLIPLGRHGTAHEIAQSVLYLASDESRFTTGLRMMVDGGMSI